MSMIDKMLPPEIRKLAEVAAAWFANSGYKEKLEEKGTTGLNHIVTMINGKHAVITFAASYISDEDYANVTNTLARQAITPATEKTEENS